MCIYVYIHVETVASAAQGAPHAASASPGVVTRRGRAAVQALRDARQRRLGLGERGLRGAWGHGQPSRVSP
jgi:hypothetical protein